MIHSNRIKEAYTREDGIYIFLTSGLNRDFYYIEVWKNKKVVEKSKEIYCGSVLKGKETEDLVWEQVEELQKKYPDLEIIDGTGVRYSVFSGNYFRHDKTDSFTKRGAKYHDYSNQEIDDMDERPLQSVKWAYLIEPGVLKIATRSSKNPGNLWDTQQFRSMGGFGSKKEQVADIEEFIDNDPNAYEGKWEDIKDEKNYMVVICDRIYRSTSQRSLLSNLFRAGLSIDGNRIKSERDIETGETAYDSDYDRERGIWGYPETISVNMDYYRAERLERNHRYSELGKLGRDPLCYYQAIIDALLMLGFDFGDEIQISDTSERGSFYVLYIDDTYHVHLTDSTILENSKVLKVGDVIMNYSHHRRRFDYVAAIKNRVATVADISEYVEGRSDSYWRDPEDYILDANKLDHYQSGGVSKAETYELDLLDSLILPYGDFTHLHTEDAWMIIPKIR